MKIEEIKWYKASQALASGRVMAICECFSGVIFRCLQSPHHKPGDIIHVGNFSPKIGSDPICRVYTRIIEKADPVAVRTFRKAFVDFVRSRNPTIKLTFEPGHWYRVHED